jgi:membrane fusion protein (multidrug efflux system)
MQTNESFMPLNDKHLLKAWVVLAALSLAGCDSGTAVPLPPPAPTVAVSEIVARPVPLSFQYAGRVAAFREVEIRARVSGILQEKSFVEGATVKADDVLFRIDAAPYETALARAKAQLKEAEAQLHRTQRDAERATALLQRQITSEKARDDAVSAYELAQASIAAAEAQVKTGRDQPELHDHYGSHRRNHNTSRPRRREPRWYRHQ